MWDRNKYFQQLATKIGFSSMILLILPISQREVFFLHCRSWPYGLPRLIFKWSNALNITVVFLNNYNNASLSDNCKLLLPHLFPFLSIPNNLLPFTYYFGSGAYVLLTHSHSHFIPPSVPWKKKFLKWHEF